MPEDIRPTVSWEPDPSPDMVDVPMRPCAFCGAQQPIAAIGINRGALLGQPTFNCWKCGRRNEGRGSFMAQDVGNELRAIFYDTDFDTLLRLRATLQAVQAGSASLPEAQVVAAVNEVSEPAARWLSSREDRRDLMTAITILLTAVGLLISWMAYSKAPDPKPPQIENLIIQVESGAITDPGLPLKAPCWCGSGKKYKHCHAAEN